MASQRSLVIIGGLAAALLGGVVVGLAAMGVLDLGVFGGAPEPDVIVNLEANQWYFEPDTVTVKLNQRVRLVITSKMDVRPGFSGHGLVIPEYGINIYLPTGRTLTSDFTANKPGNFTFTCSIYCGEGHTDMRGTLIVTET